MSPAHRVVIAGGGVGGLECGLALQAAARDRLDITLLNPTDRFVYRPWQVTEPFNGSPTVEIDLPALAADRGFAFVDHGLDRVDTHLHRASAGSSTLDYDSLVLALGARPVTVVRGALTFGGPDAGRALAEQLAGLEDGSRIAFVASASAIWTLPAYELALSTAAHRPGLRVILVTAEARPLSAFGAENSLRTSTLLRERGITVLTHTAPSEFDAERGELFVPMAGTIHVEAAVALPALVGNPIPGIPHDQGGFVAVDDHCRVEDVDDVYAVGDLTARPLKQGGLAAQQADVAAAVIARAAGAISLVEPYRPVLRAMLVTGEGPRYLRHPPAGDEESAYSPWWPPHKIAATHLGPYLATHADLIRSPERV